MRVNRYQLRPTTARGRDFKLKETFFDRLLRKLKSFWAYSSNFFRSTGFLLATGFVVIMIPMMMQLNLEMFDAMSAEMGMGYPSGLGPN